MNHCLDAGYKEDMTVKNVSREYGSCHLRQVWSLFKHSSQCFDEKYHWSFSQEKPYSMPPALTAGVQAMTETISCE